MSRHKITLKRTHSAQAFLSNQSLGSDAISALSTVPGAANLDITSEFPDHVVIEYDWTGDGQVAINEYFTPYGVEMAD